MHIVEEAGVQKQSIGRRKKGRGASSHTGEEVKKCPSKKRRDRLPREGEKFHRADATSHKSRFVQDARERGESEERG